LSQQKVNPAKPQDQMLAKRVDIQQFRFALKNFREEGHEVREQFGSKTRLKANFKKNRTKQIVSKFWFRFKDHIC
jgi:hypothetical protein